MAQVVIHWKLTTLEMLQSTCFDRVKTTTELLMKNALSISVASISLLKIRLPSILSKAKPSSLLPYLQVSTNKIMSEFFSVSLVGVALHQPIKPARCLRTTPNILSSQQQGATKARYPQNQRSADKLDAFSRNRILPFYSCSFSSKREDPDQKPCQACCQPPHP